MTESCHFDDKDSLGGSFCVWRGGSIMATTRIMPLHVGKGRTESRAISDIIDYVVNPQKTDNGYCDEAAGETGKANLCPILSGNGGK
ncbi:MAG: hypothetical protein Q3X98_04925 [Parabacteroides sp.]|nr:hypothetical protein [Parabacteroides sp.]MDR3856952.1 hypothetical protein [Parabacteroides sp.]